MYCCVYSWWLLLIVNRVGLRLVGASRIDSTADLLSLARWILRLVAGRFISVWSTHTACILRLALVLPMH